MSKIKAKRNKAKDVERKPPPQQKLYGLPAQLRQMVIQVLLTSSPRQLNVEEVNKLCNTLDQLKEV